MIAYVLRRSISTLQELKALDVYRLAEIADRLDVSVDWLLGRSEIMEVPKARVRKRA